MTLVFLVGRRFLKMIAKFYPKQLFVVFLMEDNIHNNLEIITTLS